MSQRMRLFIPVSYTHLRAHETDSYLVCRLMLEKIFFLMIRRPPRSTLSSSSAASDVYKRQEEDNWAEELLLDNHGRTTVKKVYKNVTFVSDTFIPFKCCVFTFADGAHKYAQNLRIDGAVGNGYPVEGYQTYKACPDEIYQITMGTPSSRIAPENNQVLSTRGLILSGYKEGRIVEDFTMRCRFTTFLILGFPLITQFDTQFLELENGNLIYIKDYRSQGEIFHAGDYIRYKTYTLNPNEAVVIEKTEP